MPGTTRLLSEISFAATASTLTEPTTFGGPASGGLSSAIFFIDVTGVTGTHQVDVQYSPGGAGAYVVAESLASISSTGLVVLPLTAELTATTAGGTYAIPYPTNVLVTSNTAGDELQAKLYLVTGG